MVIIVVLSFSRSGCNFVTNTLQKKPDGIKAGVSKRKVQCDVDRFFVGTTRHVFVRKQGVGQRYLPVEQIARIR
jgi:hypothetical protein